MGKTGKLTTKKLVIALIAVFLVCACGLGVLVFARGRIQEVATDETYHYMNPDETKAEADEGFKIDGVLDEAQYQNNQWLYLHNNEEGADVDIAMTSYFGDKGMYFVYDVTEGTPIYVNLERAAYMNSCVEMYLAPSYATRIQTNSLFEIDLLPTGDMTFKKSNGAGGYTNVKTKGDTMAVLGATTKGGDVNTKECYGYCLELFIPWEYMEYLNLDADAMKDSFVYVDPAHITSFNEKGTDASVDRYWYYFAQQHGATFDDVYQYFRFDGDGVQGTAPITLTGGEHYTIEGDKTVIPGMKSHITITPEEGYAISSILVNGEEYIKKASYNEDGSITLTLRGEAEGLKVSAKAETVSAGNKTLSGTVRAHKYNGGDLKDISISYSGPNGEKPITLDNKGKFVLSDLAQGYYTITVEKKGYDKIVRGILINRDMDVDLTLEYQMFTTESGYSYVLDNQNDGVLNRFGDKGVVITNDSYNKFTIESYFRYDTKLEKEAEHNHFEQQRAGFRVKFSNGKYWHINLLKEYDTYRVAYAKHTGDNSVFDWTTVYKLSEEEAAKYESAAGIQLEVQRDGKYAAIYLDGKLIATEVLDDEYAKCTAQLGFESWIANRQYEEMKYKITSSTEKNIANVYFSRPTEWDITNQFDGYITMPKDHDSDSGYLNFIKKYGNVDITVTARDYDKKDTDERLAVKFTFDDGNTLCVTITNDANKAGTPMIQALGDSILGWETLHTLTDAQVEKYQSEQGIDLRVIRKGTVVAVYVDGQHVYDADLTVDAKGKATAITADTKATVGIRSFGNMGYQVDVPFTVSEAEVETISIDLKAGDKGTPVSDKLLYMPGETVVLSGKGADGYYCTGLKVNGKDVTLNWDGTYTFKATEKQYTVEGTYDTRIFKNSKEWNILAQNQGVLSVPATHDGDSNWIHTYKDYTDVDLTVTVRDYDVSDTDERMAVDFTFDVGKTLVISVTNDANKVGTPMIQSMNNGTILGWETLHTLTEEQVKQYQSEEGIDLRVVRKGTVVAVYLGGTHVYEVDLTKDIEGNATKITAATKANIAIRNFGNKGYQVDVPFAISETVEPIVIELKESDNGTPVTDRSLYLEGDTVVLSGKGADGYYCTGLKVNEAPVVLNWDGTYSFQATEKSYTVEGTYDKKIFKDNASWNLLKQNEGVVSIPQAREGDASWLWLYNDYTDIDLTMTIRDYDSSNTDESQAVDMRFANGEYIRIRVTNDANSKGTHMIQTMDGIRGWADSWNLSDSEIASYQSQEGLKFRVIRYGTKLYVYLNDVQKCAIDLTEKVVDGGVSDSGITADMKATVGIKQYGNMNYAVDIPFVVSKTLKPVTISSQNNQETDKGTIVTKDAQYFVGDTVILKGDAEAGYYCSGMEVDGQTVELNWDGTYSFVATNTEYTVKGTFAKKVFVGSVNGNSLWNVNKQNQGTVAMSHDRTGIKGVVSVYTNTGNAPLAFAKNYKDIDLTMTVKDDTSIASTARTGVKFDFANGTTVSFTILKDGNDVIIQTMNGTGDQLDWRTLGRFSLVSATAKENYYNGTGAAFRIVRKGTQFAFTIDGESCSDGIDIATYEGYTGITAETEATVSLLHYDDAGVWIDIPFTVTDTVPNVASPAWKSGPWNTSTRYFDMLTLNAGTASENITYVGKGKAYTTLDFAIKVKEENSSKAQFEIKFKDGNDWPSIYRFKLQSQGDETYITMAALDTNKQETRVYTLTAAEAAKYKSEGINFRLVRDGLRLALYIDNSKCYLTNSTYNVCADGEVVLPSNEYIDKDCALSLIFYYWRGATEKVDCPYVLKQTLEPVTINATNDKDAEHGTIVTQHSKYYVGDKVVLCADAVDGYYCKEMKVDGKTIEMNWDGTCSFTSEKDSYEVEGVFVKKVFVGSVNGASLWNVNKQNQDTVAMSGNRTGIRGLASVYTNTGNAPLAFAKKYKDIDLTMTVKDDTSVASAARTGVKFDFANGATVSFTILKDGNDVIIQTMNGTGDKLDWQTLGRFSEVSATAKENYYNGTGAEFRVVRKGTQFLFAIGGESCGSAIDIATYEGYEDVTAETEATVSLLHYDDAGVWINMPFIVADTVSAVDSPAWKTGAWNTSTRFLDMLTLDAGTAFENITYVGKGKAYTTLDFAIKVKEENSSKAQLEVKFKDGNDWPSIYRFKLQSQGDETYITMAALGTSKKETRVYTLTAAEAAKYKSEGISFRLVRDGLRLALYIDNNKCNLTNSTYNVCQDGEVVLPSNSYIDKDCALSLIFYYWRGTTEKVDFPYELYTSVQETNSVKKADASILTLLKRLVSNN